MEVIISESKLTKVLNTYLTMSFEGFDNCSYDWANFNCGMGICCDQYAIGFVLPESEYDDYLFKLVNSEYYDDDGDYPEDLKGDLPEPCHNPPNINDSAFDTIVINAAASTVDNHADWVEKIDFSKQVFITYGHDDPMLRIASIGVNTARLGKHGARQDGKKERVAKNAIYVDFSQAVSEHRYFVGNGDQSCVYNFFNESLNGKSPDFSDRRFFTVSIPGKDYIVNK